MIKTIITSVVLFIFISLQLNAQISTDRPSQSEGPSTLGKSALQFESGIQVTANEKSNQLLLPTTLLRYGLTDNVELRLINQLEVFKYDDKSFTGISDLLLGTKLRFLKNDNIEFALITYLIAPTGTTGISSEALGNNTKLSLAHNLSSTLSIGYNIGYTYLGTGTGDLFYAVCISQAINDKASLYIEPYGDFLNLEELTASFNAGFTYRLNDNFQLDFSFGTGLTGEMNYLGMGCGWAIHK